jgi:ribonuclease HII
VQEPNLAEERVLWAQGLARVAGLDEAGRGAWAGPVVAAVVVLPDDECSCAPLLGVVRDSKLLTPRQREACYPLVCEVACGYGIGICGPRTIDRIGIVPATHQAMARALSSLPEQPQALLIDALILPRVTLPQRAIPKGDRRCLSIAAASVLAKVHRDRLMVGMDARLPGYGLARHKGYGTRQHRNALAALGPTSQHRRSFRPLRSLHDPWSR